VYRPAYSREAVLGMVASSAGTQFDPAVAAALLELVNDEP
jgi:HD-GYP domain-containing protein (c-di-GMP phosphodiesterase class II)